MAQAFNADECRAFCHPEEYVQMHAADLVELWTWLYALGYCGVLLGHGPRGEFALTSAAEAEALAAERDVLRRGLAETTDIVARYLDELPDWIETMHREATKKDVRERWAREDAQMEEGR
jgi:hypothetical protein